MPRAPQTPPPRATSPRAQGRPPTQTTSHHLRHRGKLGTAGGRTRSADSPYLKAHTKASFPREGTPPCSQHPTNTPPLHSPAVLTVPGQESHRVTKQDRSQSSKEVCILPAPLFKASCPTAVAPTGFGRLQVLPVRAVLTPASFPHPSPVHQLPLGTTVPLHPPHLWQHPCSQSRAATCSPT